jgi:choline dehydrogenase-like flavoprotein
VERFDYVIVGGGSAGCVLASRLSEDASTAVLLIEAGPRDHNPAIHIPAAFPKLFDRHLDWAYRTEPQQHLGGRKIFWPRGKVLGGSSSMNAIMWIRGFSSDYDHWAELVGSQWSYDAVLPYFVRSEQHVDKSDEETVFGNDGPMFVSNQRDPNPLALAWLAAANRCGIPTNANRNAGVEEGVALALVNQRNGRRVSAADAYLHQARKRRNLTVRTDARCLGISFAYRRATGVTFRTDRADHFAEATREVILCAGSLGSPQLLMCSGVGPGDVLARLGIPVVADIPEVGRNLQDHLTAGVALAHAGGGSLADATSLRAALSYLLKRRCLLTSNIAEGYGFIKSRPELAIPDLELLFVPGLFLDEGLTLPKEQGITLGAVLLQPKSTG